MALQFPESRPATTRCLTPIADFSNDATPSVVDQIHGTSHVPNKRQGKQEGQIRGGDVMEPQTYHASIHAPVIADVARLFPAQTVAMEHIYPTRLNERDLHDIEKEKEYFVVIGGDDYDKCDRS